MAIYSEYEKPIWDALLAEIGNEYGVAGLMGNLNAESNLFPGRVQGDFSAGYSQSVQYTQQLNAGQISESDFVYHGPGGGGYGLAQWTYSPRKQNYWNYWHTYQHGNAGTVQFEVWFLLWELQTDYSGVMNVLRNATSVRQASDVVLHQFENPEVQTEAVEIQRAGMGQNLYDEYAGSPPGPTPGGGGTAAWIAVFHMIQKRKQGVIYYRHKNKTGGGFR